MSSKFIFLVVLGSSVLVEVWHLIEDPFGLNLESRVADEKVTPEEENSLKRFTTRQEEWAHMLVAENILQIHPLFLFLLDN